VGDVGAAHAVGAAVASPVVSWKPETTTLRPLSTPLMTAASASAAPGARSALPVAK
jgi:hypothetical protein